MISVICFGFVVLVLLGKVSHMSQSLDALKAAVDATVAKVSALEAQIAAEPAPIPTGSEVVVSADLDALTAKLNAAVNPPAAG